MLAQTFRESRPKLDQVYHSSFLGLLIFISLICLIGLRLIGTRLGCAQAAACFTSVCDSSAPELYLDAVVWILDHVLKRVSFSYELLNDVYLVHCYFNYL